MKKRKHFFSQIPILRIMKIYLMLLCVTLTKIFASDAYAQNISVDANNKELKSILLEIEEKSNYSFFYNSSIINVDEKVSLKVKNLEIDKALDLLFSKTEIDFSFVRDQIILFPKNRPELRQKFADLLSVDNTKISSVAPKSINDFILGSIQSSVSGVVTDSNGVPLAGVTVMVKGTTNGASTDFDGKYTVTTSSANPVLVFSYVGFATKEVAVNNQSQINVALQEDTAELDEVVVVGYGTTKMSNVSGAVSTVSSKILENRTIRSVGEALQGTAANLNVTISDGRATSVPDINIRGFESINGGSPLIIIDGVSATASDLASLNPDDVASLTILKDAAASAIYGARASFGVLLIKTKEGSGAIKITYNDAVSFRQPTFLPDIETDPFLVLQAKDIAAYPYYPDLYNDETLAYAKLVSEGKAPAIRLNPGDNASWSYFGSTDWYSEAYTKSAITHNRNFSVSGEKDKVSYYFSGAVLQEDGAIKYGTDKFKRYNLRSKVDFKVNEWLSLGNNTSWQTSSYDEPSSIDRWLYFHQINRTNTVSVIYNPDGSYTSDGAYLIGSSKDGGRREETTNNIQTQFTAEISILKDIWKINADYTSRKNTNNVSSYSIPVPYKTGPDRPIQYQFGSETSAYRSNGVENYNAINIYTTVNKEFDKHSLSGVFGYNQEESVYNSFWTDKKDLISASLPTIQLATGDARNGAGFGDWAVRGVFGRMEYDYDDKYIFQLVGRYDGSSRFPSNDRFGFFPSFSVAWRIDKESFMKNLSVISQLKPRFSWGSLGNQNIFTNNSADYYPYIASMGAGVISPILDGEQPLAVYQPGLVSGSLTWETVESKNFGLDIELFNGKIYASADVYERLTKDMLTKSKTLPAILGASEPRENAADLKNRGWGVTVNWRESFNLGKSPFNFSLGANLSDSRAWITKFDNPDSYLDDYYVGQEIGEIWGLQSLGLYQSVEEVQNHAFEDHRASDEVRYKAVGDVQWKDLDGDGIINNGSWRYGDSGDWRVIGNSEKHYSYGVTITADWNNFDLRIFGQGVGQRDYYPGRGNHYFWSVLAQPWASVSKNVLYDSWTPENTGAYFPRLKAYAAEDYSELGIPQTRYLISAAYFRMKNITLGYTLPDSVLDKINVKKVRFYLSGENVFTISDITKYGMDPETLGGTGEYPVQKKFSLGVNFVF